MDTIYYYYYLFYTKVIPDNEPNATVIFALSFTQALFINGTCDILLAKYYCIHKELWVALSILGLILVLNYLTYFKDKKYKIVITKKPKFFNSKALSILITASWALISISIMFWGPIYVRDILDHCN